MKAAPPHAVEPPPGDPVHVPSDLGSIRRLAALLRPHRSAVAASLACMAAASGGLLVLPLLVRGMLDSAARAELPSLWLAAAMVCILLLLAICAYASSVMLHGVARRVCARLRLDYVARWLASSMDAHRSVPAGEHAERLNTCVADIDLFIKGSLANLVGLALVMAGGGAMLFWISWKLALVIVLVGPAVVALLRGIEREGRRLLRLSRSASEKMAGSLQGMVLGLDVIKAFNAEAEALARYDTEQQRLLAVQRREASVSSMVEPLLIFAGAATFLLVVFIAGRLIAGGSLDLPEFVTFLVYLMFVLPNLRNLGMQIARWRHVKVGLDFLADTSLLPAEKDATGAGPAAAGGRLEFRDVWYRHEGREEGLRGVSFAVEPGEQVGIVGESGAGKSTILSLLLRFHAPQEGGIWVGGGEISSSTLASSRALFAYVPQDTVLFDGTLGDNLRIGKPGATKAEMEAACRTAQIWDFIAGLPQGLATPVGDRGLRVSAGQRQRLAVARALLKSAPIILLDEATSALDVQTEQSMERALRPALAGRTALVVAHRPGTIASLPRILFLHGGRIAGDGTHEGLMRDNAEYRRVVGALAA